MKRKIALADWDFSYYVLQSLQVVTRQLLPKMLFPLQIAVIPKMHKSFIRISLIIVLSKRATKQIIKCRI